MKKFLQENRKFIVIAGVITVAALMKVQNTTAATIESTVAQRAQVICAPVKYDIAVAPNAYQACVLATIQTILNKELSK